MAGSAKVPPYGWWYTSTPVHDPVALVAYWMFEPCAIATWLLPTLSSASAPSIPAQQNVCASHGPFSLEMCERFGPLARIRAEPSPASLRSVSPPGTSDRLGPVCVRSKLQPPDSSP